MTYELTFLTVLHSEKSIQTHTTQTYVADVCGPVWCIDGWVGDVLVAGLHGSISACLLQQESGSLFQLLLTRQHSLCAMTERVWRRKTTIMTITRTGSNSNKIVPLKRCHFFCKMFWTNGNSNIFFSLMYAHPKFYLPSRQEDLIQGQAMAPLREKIQHYLQVHKHI